MSIAYIYIHKWNTHFFLSNSLLFWTSFSKGNSSLEQILRTTSTKQARLHIQEHKVSLQQLSCKIFYAILGKDKEK